LVCRPDGDDRSRYHAREHDRGIPFSCFLCRGPTPLKNLKQVIIELGENRTDEELRKMIEEADQDNDGEVSYEEFVHIIKKTSQF
jgi:hypothetical protein